MITKESNQEKKQIKKAKEEGRNKRKILFLGVTVLFLTDVKTIE